MSRSYPNSITSECYISLGWGLETREKLTDTLHSAPVDMFISISIALLAAFAAIPIAADVRASPTPMEYR